MHQPKIQQKEPSDFTSSVSQFGLPTMNAPSEMGQDVDEFSYSEAHPAQPAEVEVQKQAEVIQGHKTETIEFEHYYQMDTFIKGLFQLKPYMLTQFSINNFRIVVEVTAKNKQACLNGLNKTLSCLVREGCCVPVMIYTQPSPWQYALLQ